MPNADQLEKTANTHRADLANSLGSILSALNPEGRAKKAVGTTADLTQGIAQSVLDGAKRNPAGFALIGIGAALVALNATKTSDREDSRLTSYTDMKDQDARIARADELIHTRAAASTGRFATPETSSSSLRSALDKGLDRLPPEARAKVTRARLKAIDAQEAIERHSRRATEEAKAAHHNQPFLTGLMVAGVGALIGALLPSTQAEGRLMGDTRDQMMREAEAVLKDEIGKLEKQGKAAIEAGVSEAQASFEDARKSA